MGVVQTMVRISEIELKGFKNTQYGRIIMPSAGNKDFFLKNSGHSWNLWPEWFWKNGSD